MDNVGPLKSIGRHIDASVLPALKPPCNTASNARRWFAGCRHNGLKSENGVCRVGIGAWGEDSALAVTVEGTGIGISSEELVHGGLPYFRRCARTDRHQHDAGLGLSLARDLLLLHGRGTDNVNWIGEGTRVTARLPIARKAGARSTLSKQFMSIVHPIFERVIEAGQHLEKKTA